VGTDYFYARRQAAPRPTGPTWVRSEPRGSRAIGRISKLLIGQGHGFIRLHDDREVFFHRRDVADGTVFNELEIGNEVIFELLEDSISGARALRVMRRNDQ
jgi:cold shock CspA family protein